MDIQAAHDTPRARHTRGLLKPAAAILAVAGVVAASRFLPIGEYLKGMLEWTRGLGAWGPVVVAVFYLPACILMLPGSAVTLGTGFLFGPVTGTIAVSLGSTAGACAAFLVGRTVARGWIKKKVEGNAKFSAIDAAVGREGFKIVFLTRLSPIFPFNILNYAYGLTSVPFWKYALASWIGMLPGTVMFVYLGSGLSELAQIFTGDDRTAGAGKWMFLVGLVIAIAVAVVVTRIAGRALKNAVPDDTNQAGG